MRTMALISMIALTLVAPAAVAAEIEGSATRKDLAERTLTIAGQTYAVTADTRLEDFAGMRITLAQFPVADAIEIPTGDGEAIVGVICETSGQTLVRVQMLVSGG